LFLRGRSPILLPVLIQKFPEKTRDKGVGWMEDSDDVCNKLMRTYRKYGFTSSRFNNTYSMIVRHSSYYKVLVLDALALPSCPLKRLRFDELSSAL